MKKPTKTKKEPLQRQAIATTPTELRRIADDIEKENADIYKQIGFPDPKDKTIRTLITIINHSKCSDTWQFEH